MKKIHSKEDFELCYLRHQYIKRSNYVPSKEEMQPYEWIIKNLSNRTYAFYQKIFFSVGLEKQDIINIGRVQLVSFLSLFAMQRLSEEKQRDFVNKHFKRHGCLPTKKDFLDKNKANFTLFLKQRMTDLVRVCRQKFRNIKGTDSSVALTYRGPEDFSLEEIGENFHKKYSSLGFKKISIESYKSAKKAANKGEVSDPQENNFYYNGSLYIYIPVEIKLLTQEDLVSAGYDPYENFHNRTPEENFLNEEGAFLLNEKKKLFNRSSRYGKIRTIKKFIKQNINNPIYGYEIKLARDYLKTLKASTI